MFVDCETIHDGFNDVEFPRLDLAPDGSKVQTIKLKCGYALIQPLKMSGTTDSGIEVKRQDGIPTYYALVLAVSPFNVPEGGDPSINDDLPQPGQIIVKKRYAAEPLDAPALGIGADLASLGYLERSARGISSISLRDIDGILDEEEALSGQ